MHCLVRLFPFATPVQWYKKIFMEAMKGGNATHVLILTRSAHPGPIFAARQLGLSPIVLVQGATDHSRKHGEQILRAMFVHHVLPKARKAFEWRAAETGR